MTTIAMWNRGDHVICGCDTRVMYNRIGYTKTKLIEIAPGHVFGVAGTTVMEHVYKDFFLKHLDKLDDYLKLYKLQPELIRIMKEHEQWEQDDKTANHNILYWFNGNFGYIASNLTFNPIEDEFMAVGSGNEYASGAFGMAKLLGKTIGNTDKCSGVMMLVIDAACEYDNRSGTPSVVTVVHKAQPQKTITEVYTGSPPTRKEWLSSPLLEG